MMIMAEPDLYAIIYFPSMACSSVVEQLTVNQPVAGSNPAMPVAIIAQW